MSKERFTTTLESNLLEEIKILAIRKKCSTNTLLEEAIEDLLIKYGVTKKDQAKSPDVKV
jgi:metal-responsive CopG/Arc/MetJ family transcriptional regulator